MADDGFWVGLGLGALGALVTGPPIAFITWLFAEKSYNDGLKGKELASSFLGILGWTREGEPVLLPSFEKGKEVRLAVQGLEWQVYNLEQNYKELKAAYTVSQGRIKMLENEAESLRVQIEELRDEVSRRVPELSERLNSLIKRLEPLTPKQRANYST